MSNHHESVDRQKVLANFGEFALCSDDLDAVLTEGCRLVGEALGTDRAKVLEIQEDGSSLLVRAGVGWDDGVVGKVRLPMNERSSETYSIKEGKPVITQDVRQEERFDLPEFLKDAGVMALANVPIFLPGRKPYGLLQVDATEPRSFSDADTEFLRTYATILGPVIDRLHKVTTLRRTEENFRLVVENARDYAIFTTDPEDRISAWYAGAEAVFGWTADEAIGQPAAIIFTPGDREERVDAQETDTAFREGSAPNVRWHLRKDGSRVFIEGKTTALHGPDGSLRGFLKIGQDVTERRKADEALRESEARLSQFGEASSDVLWMRDAETFQWTYLTPAFETIYGLDRATALSGDNMAGWADLIVPEDRERAVTNLQRVGMGERVSFEYRIRRPTSGEIRWLRDTDFPMRDASGTVRWIGGVGRDITEEKETAEHMGVLVSELQHRTRNLMSVVRATADKTLRRSLDLPDFKARYSTRLAALSRVQGLLSRLAEGERIIFDELIRTEVAALDGGGTRIELGGPSGVALRSSTLQTFALAVHELATNAVKYGALSQPQARLEIRWHLDEADPEQGPWLHVDWRERGVIMPVAGLPRSGSGRELIERALPYQLGARTTYVMEADGVHCTIALPVSGRTISGRKADA